jgi:hypothetical protein
MSAIYAGTLVAAPATSLFRLGAEPNKLMQVNGWASSSGVGISFSGSFAQEITNMANLWFQFVLEPGDELWVRGTGDYKFIVSRHPSVWQMQHTETVFLPSAQKTAWCTPVRR